MAGSRPRGAGWREGSHAAAAALGASRPGSRRAAILDRVAREGGVPVAHLAEEFNVTTQTIRRDLQHLTARGLLQKAHGAAFAAPGVAQYDHGKRRGTLAQLKRRLVHRLGELLKPGMTVYVGLGTTFDAFHEVAALCPDLLIATPNLEVAYRCALGTKATVFVYGGYVRQGDTAIFPGVVGQQEPLFKFDLAIIGASAVDAEGTILEFDPLEVSFSRRILQNTRATVFVAHEEKFGLTAPHVVTSLAQADVLVTTEAALRKLGDLSLPASLRILTV